VIITVEITSWWGDYWFIIVGIVVLLIVIILWFIRERGTIQVMAELSITLEYRNNDALDGDTKWAVFRRSEYRLIQQTIKSLHGNPVILKDLVEFIIDYPNDGETNLKPSEKNILLNIIGDKINLFGSPKYDGNPSLINVPDTCSVFMGDNELNPIPKKIILETYKNIKLSWRQEEITVTLSLMHTDAKS
jgi:hypothetical protein